MLDDKRKIEHDEDHRVLDLLDQCRVREKRKICRQMRKGLIVYDAKLDALVWAETKEEYVMGREEKAEEDSDDDFSDDDSQGSDKETDGQIKKVSKEGSDSGETKEMTKGDS